MENENILIANFLNLTTQLHMCEHPLTGEYVDIESIEPRTDWNLIMFLVWTCKERQIYGSQYIIDDIDNSLTSNDIENAYNSCIKFINFYNKHYSDAINT